MRFDSVTALLQLLMTLSILGYSAPSLDYKKDMLDKGLSKHISYYTISITTFNKNIILDFYYYGEKVYTINCAYEKGL